MKPFLELPFGEWLPDRPAYKNPGSPSVLNCMWANGAYRPYNAFSAIVGALAARPQGAFATRDSAGNVRIYIGTTSNLYEFSGVGFTSQGAGYTAQSGSYWKFTRFSSPTYDYVAATDFNDAVQVTVPGSGVFAALAGNPPKASQIAAVNQFLMLGDTQDGTNGHVPYRVQWCGIANPTNWAYGTLAAQQAQAGAQWLNAHFGPITHITEGFAYGLIFQQRGITRAFYTGDNAVFAFDSYERQRGCAFPNSVVQVGNLVFFIAEDGFYVTDGATVTAIGHGKVDTTFLGNVGLTFAERVFGALDPANKLIHWCYCSAGNATGIPDQIITYNYQEQQFAPVSMSASIYFTGRSFGYTMDTLDNVNTNLDLINPSLDSPLWQGGTTQVSAFDSGNNYGQLGGQPLTATFDTAEVDPSKGDMTFVNGIRPKVSPGTGAPAPTVTLLYKNLEAGAYSSAGPQALEAATGIASIRQTARYVRARVSIPGGFEAALGAEFFGKAGGAR